MVANICYRFLVFSSAIIYGYYAMLLKVDEEDFGGHGALLQEGLFASITLFLVFQTSELLYTSKNLCAVLRFFLFVQLAWTLVYSLGHF